MGQQPARFPSPPSASSTDDPRWFTKRVVLGWFFHPTISCAKAHQL
jgi:hypothetical protein